MLLRQGQCGHNLSAKGPSLSAASVARRLQEVRQQDTECASCGVHMGAKSQMLLSCIMNADYVGADPDRHRHYNFCML